MIQYHCYHKRGHNTSHCPQRTLILEQEWEDQIEEVDQTVELEAYLGDENELEIEDAYVNIVHIIFSIASGSWKRTSIFYTFIWSGKKLTS